MSGSPTVARSRSWRFLRPDRYSDRLDQPAPVLDSLVPGGLRSLAPTDITMSDSSVLWEAWPLAATETSTLPIVFSTALPTSPRLGRWRAPGGASEPNRDSSAIRRLWILIVSAI